jgi:hypothetical protein
MGSRCCFAAHSDRSGIVTLQARSQNDVHNHIQIHLDSAEIVFTNDGEMDAVGSPIAAMTAVDELAACTPSNENTNGTCESASRFVAASVASPASLPSTSKVDLTYPCKDGVLHIGGRMLVPAPPPSATGDRNDGKERVHRRGIAHLAFAADDS